MKKNLYALPFVGVTVFAASASFEIRPFGKQSIDTKSGIITLTDGGEVVSNKYGFGVKAKFIEIKQDEFLKAQQATISTGEIGSINADFFNYTVSNDKFIANGNLNYSGNQVKKLKADTAIGYLDNKILIVHGQVQAEQPKISADSLIFDSLAGEVFVYGRYKFDDGKIKLNTILSNKGILITFSKDGTFKAQTNISDDKLKKYVSILQQELK